VSNTVPPNKNRFSIGHLNVCGLLGKLDLLNLFIEKHNFDIFEVTESLLQINIPGYSFERRDRGQKGGGVEVYVKSYIDLYKKERSGKS